MLLVQFSFSNWKASERRVLKLLYNKIAAIERITRKEIAIVLFTGQFPVGISVRARSWLRAGKRLANGQTDMNFEVSLNIACNAK